MMSFLGNITLCGKLNCSNDKEVDKKVDNLSVKVYNDFHTKPVVDEKIERLCDKIKHNSKAIEKIDNDMHSMRKSLDIKIDKLHTNITDNSKILLETQLILRESMTIPTRKKLFNIL